MPEALEEPKPDNSPEKDLQEGIESVCSMIGKAIQERTQEVSPLNNKKAFIRQYVLNVVGNRRPQATATVLVKDATKCWDRIEELG